DVSRPGKFHRVRLDPGGGDARETGSTGSGGFLQPKPGAYSTQPLRGPARTPAPPLEGLERGARGRVRSRGFEAIDPLDGHGRSGQLRGVRPRDGLSGPLAESGALGTSGSTGVTRKSTPVPGCAMTRSRFIARIPQSTT